MINGHKVIGVCLTKIHDTTRTDYVNRLHHLAHQAGYKLLVFNSFVDFYRNDAFDKGASSVYELIDYSLVDAVLVICDTFMNRSIIDGIVAGAKAHNVPAILVNGTAEGCACITADYRESYKSVLRHVIKDHGITDTFYIAGNGREDDTDSRVRIECYKEVLEENGIPFEESRVGYGGYWEDPTKRIVSELLADGKKPPRAILCANDHMAFTVCKQLKAAGFSVPEDVVVTGFDGVPASQYFIPRLTTCREDIEEIARLSVKAADAVLSGDTQACFTHKHVPVISESCGCKNLGSEDFRSVASELYQTFHDMEMHEDFEYSWIDRMLDISDMNSLYSTLSGCMLENSYACLNSDFIRAIMDIDHVEEHKLFSDELIVIGSKYSTGEAENTSKLKLSRLVPCSDAWCEDDAAYILNSIYVGSEVVGYYAVRTDNMPYSTRKMKRVVKTINIAFNVALNYFRQQKMSQQMERAELINTVTKLPNLKGSVKWFEEFSAAEENRSKTLSISVYGLPKYTYIYENYGVEAIEEALRLVSESLKMANPVNCFIGHIAEDEYAVINYYDDPTVISDTINKATSVFFSLIEGYNTDSGKEYYVEVNCGCTVVNSYWNGSLEGFIKFANSEMYMNRLKNGEGSAVKEKAAPKEHYKAFDLL
ncbi:MAG: GGDEF domain-containing protein, partial [Oscillospiraceae bacterium]|nr:GGDEF domain-containing protein [Oscillospiraceae bacterium]